MFIKKFYEFFTGAEKSPKRLESKPALCFEGEVMKIFVQRVCEKHFLAHLEGRPEISGGGDSYAEAVGELICVHQGRFGIEVRSYDDDDVCPSCGRDFSECDCEDDQEENEADYRAQQELAQRFA